MFFPNARAELPPLSVEIEFSNQVIKGVKFHAPDDHPLKTALIEFEQKIAGKNLTQALKLPWPEQDYLPAPKWLLLKARDNHCDHPRWADTNQTLLCRCFGVSVERITTFCQTNPTPTLASIADHLRAGSGCATCLDDLRSLLIPLRTKPKTWKRIRLGNQAPVQVMLQAHQLIQEFIKKNAYPTRIELQKLEERQLFFTWRGRSPKAWLARLEHHLCRHFQDEVLLTPLSPLEDA